VIKTVSPPELKIYLDKLESFYHYQMQNPASLIAKIYGVFTIRFDTHQQTVILMENLLKVPKQCKLFTFDMKGSKYSRQVLKSEKDLEIAGTRTLKDLDFIKLEEKLKMDAVHKQYLLEQIKSDARFFQRMKIIDYSLIVFIIQRKPQDEKRFKRLYGDDPRFNLK